MDIKFNDEEITFTFPRNGKRYNPYDEDNDYGLYPYFTGLIVRHNKNGSDWDEMGFAGTIDMTYKGKGDQFSDFIVMWDGDEDSFKDKCKELEIDIAIMEV